MALPSHPFSRFSVSRLVLFLYLLQFLRSVQIQFLTNSDHILVCNLYISAKQLCQSHVISPSDLGKRITTLYRITALCIPDALGRSAVSNSYQIIAAALQCEHGLSGESYGKGSAILQASLLCIIAIQVCTLARIVLAYIYMNVDIHSEAAGISDTQLSVHGSGLCGYHICRDCVARLVYCQINILNL